MDHHSHARPAEVRVQHLQLDLDLDFAQRVVRGTVRLDLERADPKAPLRLDCAGPKITAITGSDGTPRKWALGTSLPHVGPPLTVELADADRTVTIAYATTPEAAALQWLEPAQTAGGKQPFLFTQGQAILTRTWIPVQDTPGNRVTYEAFVRAPRGLVPIMAAQQLPATSDGRAHFRMAHPIPTYLIALACGDLAFVQLSARCGVWAEPSVVRPAAKELADTEAMVQAAEKLFGPYRWGRYDLLILPPAFPFGGMENPCLTFATPTILAGDKSLVNLVAHELAHSWSGNLVTNATWRDFWLNEGFTVYFEHRILEAVYGEDRAVMERLIGLQDLQKELRELPPADQILHLDLRGRNPDDAMTAVAYEKGAWFLATLEAEYGRATLDSFLTRWFDGHAFQSVTTGDFEAWLHKALLAKNADKAARVPVRAWIHEPGIPDGARRPACPLFAAVDAAVADLGRTAETRHWVTQQWLRFLHALPQPLTNEQMRDLDGRFGFTGSGNSEILCAWLERAIASGYTPADARLEEFLLGIGRRKFLKPLYEALCKTEAGRVRAKAIYERARPRYHAVATRTLDPIVAGKKD